MGRVRKTLRWTFSFGGTGVGSPFRAESSAESDARRVHELMEEQNDLLRRLVSGQEQRQQGAQLDSRALLDDALRDLDDRGGSFG